jgi:pimeloyl-ACP methyl ester carboxylesterase
MERESLEDVVLVGHWLTGTQVALHLALRHPNRITALVLAAGSARWVTAEADPQRPDDFPLAERVARIDGYMAPQWFKTVTRETWDDNNFLPGDYAVNPVLGLRLWREAARPPLHAWVRYLNEFFAQDATLLLEELVVPTLLLKPGLEGIFHDPGNNYVYAYLDRGRGRWSSGAGPVESRIIPGSRIVPWADEPNLVEEAVADFLGLGSAGPEVHSGRIHGILTVPLAPHNTTP